MHAARRRGPAKVHALAHPRLNTVNMLRPMHFELRTLGELALRTPSVDSTGLTKRRRKLAVLAVLALSRRAPARDALVEMFWGDEPEDRARHSLSDALSHLRRVLGRDAIVTRGDLVQLDLPGRLSVDALAFESACERGDWKQAIDLYGGPFLLGFHLDGAGSLERWIARHRSTYERRFEQACEAQLELLVAAGDGEAARGLVARWQALLDSTTTSEVLARGERRVAAFEAPVVERFSEPEEAAAVLPRADVEASGAPRTPRRFPMMRIGALAAGVTVLAALGWGARRRVAAAEQPVLPTVALTGVHTDRGDSSLAWLREGFREMVAADLAHVTPWQVIAPSTVRDAEERAGMTADSADVSRTIEVARRVHATLAVDASVSRNAGVYVVDVFVRPVNDRSRERHSTVTGPDILSLADQVSALILAEVSAATPGPRLSSVETSSASAFRHFVDGMRLQSEGMYDAAARELDAAIAADSGFTSAIVARLHADSASYARLKPLFERARLRLTEWDRLSETAYEALHSGDHARAEALARELVARFPNDPRALEALAATYSNHGRLASAESAYVRLLALDSLAMLAGSGPCAPCSALGGLAMVHHLRGEAGDEIRVVKRWVDLQPAIAKPWAALADAQAFDGDFGAALASIDRARTLSDDAGLEADEARILLMARRPTSADSVARDLAPRDAAASADIDAMALRERGDFREAVRSLDAARRRKIDVGLEQLEAHMIGSLGDEANARRLFEGMTTHPSRPSLAVKYKGAFAGDDARAFAWHHALEADAIWRIADTAYLRALADSVERIGSQSYYSRDWQLHHHIRGLIAERAGRLDEAERELTAGLSVMPGWTRTNVELARVLRARGNPSRALAVLRAAYHEPLDAMGRYVPRSVLDAEVAETFTALGKRDSADVYAGYARNAWKKPDREVLAPYTDLRASISR